MPGYGDLRDAVGEGTATLNPLISGDDDAVLPWRGNQHGFDATWDLFARRVTLIE